MEGPTLVDAIGDGAEANRGQRVPAVGDRPLFDLEWPNDIASAVEDPEGLDCDPLVRIGCQPNVGVDPIAEVTQRDLDDSIQSPDPPRLARSAASLAVA